MAQNPLPPPPPSGSVLDGWLYLLWRRLTATGQILWSSISFTGSNITDIETRDHADLQNLNTASYSHLTATQVTDLTDGGSTTLHTHAIGGYTVATLPTGTVGDRAYVTDALAPAYGVAVAGGGAVTIPVFYNGAAWICA